MKLKTLAFAGLTAFLLAASPMQTLSKEPPSASTWECSPQKTEIFWKELSQEEFKQPLLEVCANLHLAVYYGQNKVVIGDSKHHEKHSSSIEVESTDNMLILQDGSVVELLENGEALLYYQGNREEAFIFVEKN